MGELADLDIRYTVLSDAPYLREWVMLPNVQKWFPFSTEKEIADAVECWIGFCRYSCSLTATVDGVPCGIATLFLMPYKKVSHHSLFKVVVDPKFQRRGVGTALVKNLKHLAKNYFNLDLIHIEVFEGNPLIDLLKKFEFHEFARQKSFVKEDGHYLGRVCLESFL